MEIRWTSAPSGKHFVMTLFGFEQAKVRRLFGALPEKYSRMVPTAWKDAGYVILMEDK